jgi:hypothetical protein
MLSLKKEMKKGGKKRIRKVKEITKKRLETKREQERDTTERTKRNIVNCF